MKTRLPIVSVAVLALVCMTENGQPDVQKRFSDLWYDGNAEISTYAISEMRYGEPRDGMRIMVFVTEPMCISEARCPSPYVKPDKKVPEQDKIDVIKLNDLRKFPTGIYEYSTMTSVFTAVEEKERVPIMAPMKVVFTSQEWCGTVYERVIRRGDTLDGILHSYFESEGDHNYRFPHHDTIQPEDNLWILIRELTGPLMKSGESRTMKVVPGMWARRKTHVLPSVKEITLTKGKKEKRKTVLGKIDAHPFAWGSKDKKTRVWVEAAYPHRILSWEEDDGSSGELKATGREPYWKQNANNDLPLRDKYGLPK